MRIEPEKLLVNSQTLKTSSVAEFHSYLAGFDGVVTRKAVEAGPVTIEFRHSTLGKIDLGLLYSSVTMVVSAERKPSDDYLLQFPLSGELCVELSGCEYAVSPPNGILIPPSEPVTRISHPGWTLVFGLPAFLVRARLEDRIGRLPEVELKFAPLVNAAAGELLNFGLLVVEAHDRGNSDPGAGIAEALVNGLIDLLLTIQPHNCGELLSGVEVTRRSTRIEVVSNYVDQHLQESLPIGILAEAAGCSPRALQKTFIELCGMTPVQFVRRRRLLKARKLLEAGNPALRVSDVIGLVGYAHAARFASEYKALFGESPLETIKRVGQMRD